MSSSAWSDHFTKAFHWSREAGADRTEILSSAMGIAGPAVLGAATGHLPAGLGASLGGLMIGGMVQGLTWRSDSNAALLAALPALAATVLAALLAGRGWTAEALLLVLAAAAALFGGYSRPRAIAAARFIPYLVIAFSAAEAISNRIGFVLFVVGGIALTIASGLLVAVLWRMMGHSPIASAEPPASTATAAQRRRRFWRNLHQMDGWHYTLRLMLCLALAAVIRLLYPQHHFLWISLTVALVMERQIETLTIRTTQRIAGTALGAAASSLFLFYWPPQIILAMLLVLLAAARPIVRKRNYLVYSLVQTVIIVIILDRGGPPEPGLLSDRLVATVIGAGLVVGSNFLFQRFAKA